jgi:hypothetical protein
MRLRDGQYECTLCGQVLDIPPTKDPDKTIVAHGGEPNRRTLTLDGTEIHRCDVDQVDRKP